MNKKTAKYYSSFANLSDGEISDHEDQTKPPENKTPPTAREQWQKKTSNLPISPTKTEQLTSKQVKKIARAGIERKRKDNEAKRNLDDDQALKEAMIYSGKRETITQFENLPDIDETGNAVNNEEESGKIFIKFCEIYQNAPITNYERETPKGYLPYNPLHQAQNADKYTGQTIAAWDIATYSSVVPISQMPIGNFLNIDGSWLPPPFDISKDYGKGKTGLIWDPTQPMG